MLLSRLEDQAARFEEHLKKLDKINWLWILAIVFAFIAGLFMR